MARTVPEWIGKTDDTRPPPHVKLRIYRAHGGRCHLTGRKIRGGEGWDLDHVKALCNGGENRESNLAPALRAAHKIKTTADREEKEKTDRMQQKHLGIYPRSPWKLRGRGFPKRSPTRRQHD